MPTSVTSYLDHGYLAVRGMSSLFAARIIVGLLAHQTASGVVGQVAEIGVFEGRLLIAMALSLADVERIAYLARIEITPAEASDVQAKLGRIFDMIGELRAVDTTGITPMSHAQDLMLPLRPDVVAETDQHLVYQQNAPATEGGLYLVPKVIE